MEAGLAVTLFTLGLMGGFLSGLIGIGGTAYSMPGPNICVSGLTTKQAAGVDAAIDGPVAAGSFGNIQGSVRGVRAATAPLQPAAVVPGTGTAYNESIVGLWTLCRRL